MSSASAPRTPPPPTPVLAEVEATLCSLVSALEPAAPLVRRPGRPRVLPALCLWGGMLVCVLRGFSSQSALWRLLTQFGLWHFPRLALSDQAIYHRLARDGVRPLEELFAQLTTLLAERLTPYLPSLGPDLAPFAREIVALDESTLDPVARRLPSQGSSTAPPRRLPGKLAGLFDIRRQLWRTIRLVADAQQNEKVLARTLVATLPPGSLILADLGYFGFRWFDDLTEQGYWWLSRLRAKTSYEIVTILAQHGDNLDALVWLGAYRADRAKHLVRLVQYRQGGHLRRFITNVRDPHQLSPAAIVQLYARRWDIEMAFQLIKQHLGLSLWWSTKEVIIHQQLLAVLCIAQIVQALRVEIAARAGVDLFAVSLPLLVRSLPQFAARGEDPVTAIVERGRPGGFIRPSRRIPLDLPDPPLAHACSLGPIPLTRPPRYAGKQ